VITSYSESSAALISDTSSQISRQLPIKDLLSYLINYKFEYVNELNLVEDRQVLKGCATRLVTKCIGLDIFLL
jgi:hypothetical protein